MLYELYIVVYRFVLVKKYCDHGDLHVQPHALPTRRATALPAKSARRASSCEESAPRRSRAMKSVLFCAASQPMTGQRAMPSCATKAAPVDRKSTRLNSSH